MERLTDEDREAVARAWRVARPVIRRHRGDWPGPEYDGFVAERLCRSVARRDRGGDLAAWAAGVAWHACRDARREARANGFVRAKRVVGRRPGVGRLSEMESGRDDRHRDADGAWIPSRDAGPEWERREAFDAILIGVAEDARRVMTALYWDGLKQREAADACGLSPSRICHIHADTLALLRARSAELVA